MADDVFLFFILFFILFFVREVFEKFQVKRKGAMVLSQVDLNTLDVEQWQLGKKDR